MSAPAPWTRFALQSGEKLLSGLMSLGFGLWLARRIGPETFGSLSVALATVAIFGALSSLGIGTIVTQQFTHGGLHETRRAALAARLGGGILALLILAGMAVLEPSRQEGLLLFCLAWTVLLQAVEVDEWRLIATGDATTLAATRLATALLGTLLRIVAVLADAPLFVLGLLYSTEYLLRGWAYHRSLQRLPPTVPVAPWSSQLAPALSLLRRSWPLAVSTLAILLYMRIDQVMLGEISGPAAAGIYSVAVNLTEALYLIPVLLLRAYTPELMRAASEPERFLPKLLQVLRVATWIGVSLCLATTLLGPTLIGWLLGPDYEAVGPLLQVQAWALLFVGFGVFNGFWLVQQGLERLALARTLAGAVCNILLNLWWIPAAGPLGAAWATLCSQALASWLMDLAQPQTRPMFLLKLRAFLPVFARA